MKHLMWVTALCDTLVKPVRGASVTVTNVQ